MTTGVVGTTHRLREERWKEEADFFDNEARRVQEGRLPLDPLALRRYSGSSLRKRFSMEFRFSLLGCLKGRSVLDVGCGDGLNAVIFAKLGAKVTGVDVSPGAVYLARRRAEVNGVADRAAFICSPIEMTELPNDSFDVVWGDGFLHHVVDDLDAVMRRLMCWVKPDGLVLFSEPVNLFEPLRRLRRMVPVRTDATPGERPLVRSELDLVKRYIPDLRTRHYLLLGRLDRFILVNCNYERSSAIRRAIVNGIDLMDYVLLSLPLMHKLAGAAVLYGHPGQRVPHGPARCESSG
jgi:2-polyprenyl-3-methyl-5-hydroxy-6-metoxy-1,4-benzoquinol methylase